MRNPGPEQELLAHGGGVPEALTIVLPIVIFVVFMLLQRRSRQRSDDADDRPPGAEEQ